jgi:hypothetical protein
MLGQVVLFQNESFSSVKKSTFMYVEFFLITNDELVISNQHVDVIYAAQCKYINRNKQK